MQADHPSLAREAAQRSFKADCQRNIDRHNAFSAECHKEWERINKRGDYAIADAIKGGGGNGGSGISSDGAVGLTLILGVLIAIGWALATFGAFLTGPLAAFGTYKGLKWMTGKDKDDYNAIATGQSKSIGSIICLLLIFSSGIVGARWGHGVAADFNCQ